MFRRFVSVTVKKWKSLKRHVEKAIIGALVVDKKSHSLVEPHNIHYRNLQRCYLIAFYLAMFADWLQGPYLYQLYKHYGYTDDLIAVLYIAGFSSSCIFGTLVGQLADRYGRKLLCSTFSALYILCCLSKISPNFAVLLIGRVLGGIATSILFTTFEAWYVNEHITFFKLPTEWLNTTFSKATFYNGLSAIFAGLLAQLFAEYFNLGPASPFLLAIPFLLLSLLVIQSTWKEHIALPKQQQTILKEIIFPLKILKHDDYLLFYLGCVQSAFEAAMYTFVFSWTPILADLKPPLGIVFSFFMISLICGSKTYSWLVSRRYQPHHLLVVTCIISTIAFVIVTVSLTTIVAHVQEHDPLMNKSMGIICFVTFLIYEWAVGIYYPATGYLRSRTIPEEYRATLSNWFRVPMNMFTCINLTLKYGSDNSDVTGLRKFQFVFALSSLTLAGAVLAAIIFSKKYSRKIIHDELIELKSGKTTSSETV